jgi:hypothetical protein
VEAGGPIASGGTERGWERRHIQGRGTNWDRWLKGKGGRLRGEREKVERVSYKRGRERIVMVSGVNQGLSGIMCIAYDWTHV